MSFVNYVVDKLFSYFDGVSLCELPMIPYEVTKVDDLKSIVVSPNGKFFALHTGDEVQIWCTVERALRRKEFLGPSFENSTLDLNDDGILLVSNTERTVKISLGVTEYIDSFLTRWIDSNTTLNLKKDKDGVSISLKKITGNYFSIGTQLVGVTILDAHVISRNEVLLYLLDEDYGKVIYFFNFHDLELKVLPLPIETTLSSLNGKAPDNNRWSLPILNRLNPHIYTFIWTNKEGNDKIIEGKNVKFTKNKEGVIFFHTSDVMGYNPKCKHVLITTEAVQDGKIMVNVNLSETFVFTNK